MSPGPFVAATNLSLLAAMNYTLYTLLALTDTELSEKTSLHIQRNTLGDIMVRGIMRNMIEKQ